MFAANDNEAVIYPASRSDLVPGRALRISRPASRGKTCFAEFVSHSADREHVIVRKLISSLWRARWTKPMKVHRSAIVEVYDSMAR